MISSISNNVHFRGEAVSAQDLINSPGNFSANIPADKPDTFEKAPFEEENNEKSYLPAIIGTAVAALAAFVGLGVAVKKGKLEKVEVAEADSFFKKLWTRTKNVGFSIGEAAGKCYDKIAKLFGKETEKVAEK